MLIKCKLDEIKQPINHHIYLGTNLKWAEYILAHRANNEEDPCQKLGTNMHGDVISGPMADNKIRDFIGKYTFRYQQGDQSVINQFYDKISSDNDGKKLSAFKLGYQITFSNEELAKSLLELEGYWVMNKGGWKYEEI